MPMHGAKRTNSRRFGETAGKPGTAGVAADGFPDRSARALSASPRQCPLGAVQPAREREKASLALVNLRGLAIAFVLMTHASLAYVASAPPQPFPFDRPPYGWIFFPILDARRWLGLDVFCGWQDVYLMSLWFFLSGVFAWPSIEREGGLVFLAKRVLRLGAPLLFGVALLMPVALYPVYRVTAADPTLAGYAREYLALPFTPCGPLWFLWLLLAFTLGAAALHRFARRAVLRIGDLSRQFEERPARTFAAWALDLRRRICAARAPVHALELDQPGPIRPPALPSSPLRRLLFRGPGRRRRRPRQGNASRERMSRRENGRSGWRAAGASLALWMGLTALALRPGSSPPLLLSAADDASYALADACSVVFVLAIFLRFGAAGHWPLLASLSDNAFGLYVLHYAPVVWLQYALLGLAWPVPLKAALVLCGATASCMTAIAAARSLRRSVGARLSSRWVWGS